MLLRFRQPAAIHKMGNFHSKISSPSRSSSPQRLVLFPQHARHSYAGIISGSDHNTFDHGFCSLLFYFFQKYLRPSHGSGISTGGNAILQMQGSLTDSIKDQDQCPDLCNTGRASSGVRIPGIDHCTVSFSIRTAPALRSASVLFHYLPFLP